MGGEGVYAVAMVEGGGEAHLGERNQKRFCLSGPRLLKPVPRPELFHNQPSTYDRVSRRRGPMSAWGITQLSVLKDTFSRDIFISVLVLRLLSLLKY